MVKDLTEGSPRRVLWQFTIPMFVSVVFQQLYNIADSIIAGQSAGEDALAAVGASYPVTMIFMAIAVGSNIGCSVVISNLFGAKKYKEMKTAVYTTLVTAFVLSVVLTVAGLLGTGGLMAVIRTPENIFADGALYLGIYIGGFTFLFLYNVATGIFSALGDSKTPLYFLIASSLGNILLDYIFVAVCGWGVAGVAWATFAAQGIACVLALFTMKKRLDGVKTEGGSEFFSWEMLRRIGQIAVPSILQQSFVSVGNIFIQGLVNSYGSSVIAGYSAAVKLNTFAITSFTTLGNGISNFTAQNLGAGKGERVREGFRAGIQMAVIVVAVFFAAFFLNRERMVRLFMGEESTMALSTGMVFLEIVSPFYIIISVKLLADGVLRGAGAMRQFMASTFTDLVLRVVLAFLLSGVSGSIGIWLSWPVGWGVAAVMSVVFYRKLKLERA